MNSLNISYMRGKNILCFGPEGFELHFSDFGPIVLVKGINKDTGTVDTPASNAAGKSSIQDVLVWILTGKTVKKPKKIKDADIINVHADGKGCEGELILGEYRILRKLGPAKLQIWKSKDHIWDKDSEITKGGKKGINQEYINEQILPLAYLALVNVLVFDDGKAHAFLEADGPTKREIVENTLGLDLYRQYNDTAKNLLKDAKAAVKELTAVYERLQNELDACQKRIDRIKEQEKAWIASKQDEAKALNGRIEHSQDKLSTMDGGLELQQWLQAQDRIKALQTAVVENRAKQAKMVEGLEKAKGKLDDANKQKNNINTLIHEQNLTIKEAQAELARSGKLVTSLNGLNAGSKCPVCHGLIDTKNYASVLEHEEHCGNAAQAKIDDATAAVNDHLAKLKECQTNITKLDELMRGANTQLKKINSTIDADSVELTKLSKLSKPDVDATQRVLESEIAELKKQIEQKEAELLQSPYVAIMASAVEEQNEKQKENDAKVLELRSAENEVPYYEYWVKAFGDQGIRKIVIDGVIPAFNSRVAYWMQHLYNGKITLTFDNEFDEKILRDGAEVSYAVMSNGEQQRVNLAVSQAFAYIMMLNSGISLSLVFLDEVTGGSIDKVGVSGVFNMICELSKERQVFVTTHNEYLLNMLDGCDTLTLTKEKDITTISK